MNNGLAVVYLEGHEGNVFVGFYPEVTFYVVCFGRQKGVLGRQGKLVDSGHFS